MLPEFNVIRVSDLNEAVKLLSTGKYRVIAGGTDVLVELRKMKEIDYNLLDLSGARDLRYIKEDSDKIRAGAMTTITDILESEIISRRAPLLQKAVENFGCLQIRNRATIGGNIVNASPAADSLPALCALDAEVVLVSAGGKREMALTDFLTGAGSTAALNGELLAEVVFSCMPPDAGYSFIKLARREALSASRINVAVYLQESEGIIKTVSLATGSVMPTSERISEAEEILVGKKPSEKIFRQAGEQVGKIMEERSGLRWSTEYKNPVIRTLVRRALSEAAGI